MATLASARLAVGPLDQGVRARRSVVHVANDQDRLQRRAGQHWYFGEDVFLIEPSWVHRLPVTVEGDSGGDQGKPTR